MVAAQDSFQFGEVLLEQKDGRAPQLVELVGRLLLGLGGLAPDRSRDLISRVSMRSHIYMRSYRPAVSATMVGEPEVPAKRRNVYLRHRRQQHTRGKPGSPSD